MLGAVIKVIKSCAAKRVRIEFSVLRIKIQMQVKNTPKNMEHTNTPGLLP